MSNRKEKETRTDVLLIGAGIMSATLGILLKELDPELNITIIERLDTAAAESSDAWNNAGTGHSAFCELNYTPELEDGTINIKKAVQIATSFEESKQFWAYLVKEEKISPPGNFIRSIPHMSFVWGNDNVSFLRKRYNAMRTCHLFRSMLFSDDPGKIAQWAPIVMHNRPGGTSVAATKMDMGTDVNFGSLTRCIFKKLKEMKGVSLHFHQEVSSIERDGNNWTLTVKDKDNGLHGKYRAAFVFIGAGGGSLPLLLKSGIPEAKGYGGFPVSGQWLKCTNEAIIERHHAKVYGKAAMGAPPMSVPHLDTRFIKGKKELLFGPFAGFSTRFLKNGSFMDLPLSIRLNNIRPMLSAGLHNIPLTKYLIEQVRQSPEERIEALRAYFPDAVASDWTLEIAGQRVQVIKKDKEEGGVLEFGTEVVTSADGTIAALLGASPGASTAVSIMISLLQKCFSKKFYSDAWQRKIKEMIPSAGLDLGKDEKLCMQIRNYSHAILGLPADGVSISPMPA